ncbi:MAG TPA: ATP-binding protein [Burkholderiales bacterium]|nr:ATP-binding protein [Burkholderiales bacterium]
MTNASASPVAAGALSAGPALRTPDVTDSFWVSLRYFNAYRLAVAVLLLVLVIAYGDALALGQRDLFGVVGLAYLLAAVVFHVVIRRVPRHFETQLTAHVCTDIVAIVLLMYASGGFRTGLAVMLLISLAAASLVSRGRLLLFYAALASVALLLEQTVWVVRGVHGVAEYLPAGLLCIGYFATALITNRLAQRVITNERVARQRGIDLANQLRVNQLVIQDVQDGVLVVDSNGLVRQHNPVVDRLLGRSAPELDQIDAYSHELARALREWREGRARASAMFRFSDSGILVRARFVDAGVVGDSFAVIYLEDISKLEDQARQMKLAALGRLTANIAHEIRNPLAAMIHAAELMLEENRAPARERLTRIIRDNAKRLDRMVKDVLELNRRDRVQPDPVRLGAFVETFLEEFAQNEQIDRSGFALAVEGDGIVDFDRVHLNQILWNLARNAWRHSRKVTGSVRMRIHRQGNRMELHVSDDGPGVAKDLQGQLFEPFFTTYSAGTGLGLYIARELCAANGATLEYVDRPAGADFRITWLGIRQ